MTTLVGRTYLERGRPVVVLAQWLTASHLGRRLDFGPREREVTRSEAVRIMADTNQRVLFGVDQGQPVFGRKTGPRNVLIRREDGELVVRPFRGLRRDREEART